MQADWESAHPLCPMTLSGFIEAMSAGGEWTPLPLAGAAVGASGPSSTASSSRSATRSSRACARRCRWTASTCRCTARRSHRRGRSRRRDPRAGARVVGPSVRSLPRSTCTPMCPRRWCARRACSWPTAPIRTSTWPSAAPSARKLMRECLAGARPTAALVRLPADSAVGDAEHQVRAVRGHPRLRAVAHRRAGDERVDLQWLLARRYAEERHEAWWSLRATTPRSRSGWRARSRARPGTTGTVTCRT